MSKLIGWVIAGGAVVGIVKLLQMQNVSNQSTMKLVNPRIHQVNLGGISFRTEVSINNPSNDSVTITKPVVSLISGSNLLAQSLAENKTIEIRPLGATQIDTIELLLSWTVIAKLVKEIIPKIPGIISAFRTRNFKDLSSKIGVPIDMTFSTYVNGIFYQSEPTKII